MRREIEKKKYGQNNASVKENRTVREKSGE